MADLANALSWPGVDDGDEATETGLAAELRRGAARRWRLPSTVSEHWWTQWVARVAVDLLRWQRSSEDELSSAMAPAALGAGTAAATGEEEGRGEANGVLG